MTGNVKLEAQNVFLIGYRGTGKTTVARLLAARIGWSWRDADDVMEQRHGRTIREIFALEGETGFRDKEAALLEELCALRTHVIATGGGALLRPENRQRLRASGFVVWLSADADTIWRRLQSDPLSEQRRPALTVGGRAEIEALLHEREPLYRGCADLVVDTSARSPEQVVEAVVDSGSGVQFMLTAAPSPPPR
jgi:shikimate kinase